MAGEFSAGTVVIDVTTDSDDVLRAFNQVQNSLEDTAKTVGTVSNSVDTLETQFLDVGAAGVRSSQQASDGLERIENEARGAITAVGVLGATSQKTGGIIGALGGKSNRAALVVTQMGFAAEDAITVYGNMGLAGALRAAGNNVSFMASQFSPIAGLLVGVGAASVALIAQFAGMEDEVEEDTDAVDELAAALQNLERVQRELNTTFKEGKFVDVPAFIREAQDFSIEERDKEMQRLLDETKRRTIRQEDLRDQISEALQEGGMGALSAENIAGLSPHDFQQAIDDFEKRNPGFEVPISTLLDVSKLGTDLLEVEKQFTLISQKRSALADIPGIDPAIAENQESAADLLDMTITKTDRLMEQQKELNRLKELGLFTDEEYQAVTAEITKQLNEQNPLYSEAQKLIEDTKTDLERFKEQQGDINAMQQAGFLSAEQAERAMDLARDQFEASQDQEPVGPPQLSQVLTAGSSAAISALNKAMTERGVDPVAKAQEKGNKDLAKIEKNTRNQKQIVFTV